MIPIHGADIVGIESQANDLLYAVRYFQLADEQGRHVQQKTFDTFQNTICSAEEKLLRQY